MLELEASVPKLLSLSAIHGFMAGDVPEMGTKVIAVTDDDPALGAEWAERLGMELFANRGRHMMPVLDEKAAVAQAIRPPAMQRQMQSLMAKRW